MRMRPGIPFVVVALLASVGARASDPTSHDVADVFAILQDKGIVKPALLEKRDGAWKLTTGTPTPGETGVVVDVKNGFLALHFDVEPKDETVKRTVVEAAIFTTADQHVFVALNQRVIQGEIYDSSTQVFRVEGRAVTPVSNGLVVTLADMLDEKFVKTVGAAKLKQCGDYTDTSFDLPRVGTKVKASAFLRELQPILPDDHAPEAERQRFCQEAEHDHAKYGSVDFAWNDKNGTFQIVTRNRDPDRTQQ